MTWNLKILVVEDFKAFRRLVCRMLERRAGCEIIESADGLDAVHKAEELQPDLILLDIHLPNLNGIEVARRLQNFAKPTRILFLSQERSVDFVQAALALGALGYVQKLRVHEDLLRAIDTVLQGRHFVSDGLLSTSSSKSFNMVSA